MEKKINFTTEELNKIKLSKFIAKLFVDFSCLHTISIIKSNISMIENGKDQERKSLISISASFKYSSFYCHCHGDKMRICEDESELFSGRPNVFKDAVQSIIPMTFYLKGYGKKTTYQEFEAKILSKIKEYGLSTENMFGERTVITFSKNKIINDLSGFLGNFIISKQFAKQLECCLPNKNEIDKKIVKI